MKVRVTYMVPSGINGAGIIQTAIRGTEYECDDYTVGKAGELCLIIGSEAVMVFAPTTWRTITKVGAFEAAQPPAPVPEAKRENPRRQQKERQAPAP